MKKRPPPSHQLIKNKTDMMQSLLSDDRYFMVMPKSNTRLPAAKSRYAQFGSRQDEVRAEISGEKKALEKKLESANQTLEEIVEGIEKSDKTAPEGEVAKNSTIHVKIK